MNERIQELAEEAGAEKWGDSVVPAMMDIEKFAQLIVQECIKTIEYRAPGQMGEVGKGWTNGYDDGLKTGAWLLKEHFGVER